MSDDIDTTSEDPMSRDEIENQLTQLNGEVSPDSPMCLCVITDLEHNVLTAKKVRRLACLAFDRFHPGDYIVDPEPI
jgi:hypothetical protein